MISQKELCVQNLYSGAQCLMREMGNGPSHYFPVPRIGIKASAEARELGLRHDLKCSLRGKRRLPVGGTISVNC